MREAKRRDSERNKESERQKRSGEKIDDRQN